MAWTQCLVWEQILHQATAHYGQKKKKVTENNTALYQKPPQERPTEDLDLWNIQRGWGCVSLVSLVHGSPSTVQREENSVLPVRPWTTPPRNLVSNSRQRIFTSQVAPILDNDPSITFSLCNALLERCRYTGYRTCISDLFYFWSIFIYLCQLIPG